MIPVISCWHKYDDLLERKFSGISVDIIENQETTSSDTRPSIYFNAFIHVYSPRAGADNSLGTNVDVNRKPLSRCPFVASFKTIFLKYDFKNI